MSSISGSHLRIIPFHIPPSLTVKRDTNGNIINITGSLVSALQWLSDGLNFTFDYIKETNYTNFIEDQSPDKPGQMGFLLNNKADVIIGAVGFTEKRNQLMTYPYAMYKARMALMIPKPTQRSEHHLDAIWKPFQPQVWIYVGISMLIGVISLYAIGRIRSRVQKSNSIKDNKSITEYQRLESTMAFFFGVILLQGSLSSKYMSRVPNKQIAIRFLTGAWCVACFVLISAYSSVLIAFVTSPDPFKPLINSVYDLPKKPEVRLTVKKGWIADLIFQNAIHSESAGILKYLGEDLKRHPEQRYETVDQCVEEVRKGSSVYVFSDNFVLSTIGEEWKKTGRCDFTVAKEMFSFVLGTGFLLQKNFPYTEHFNRGIMRMEALGLTDIWWKQFSPDPTYCLTFIEQQRLNKKGRKNKTKLTLKGLSGAFIVLIAGYIMAMLVFILELVLKRLNSKRIASIKQRKPHPKPPAIE